VQFPSFPKCLFRVRRKGARSEEGSGVLESEGHEDFVPLVLEVVFCNRSA
jgi:hypothetical protein